jgi:hypothetical protein
MGRTRRILYIDFSVVLRLAAYAVPGATCSLFIREEERMVDSAINAIAERMVAQLDWVTSCCEEVILVLESGYSDGKITSDKRRRRRSKAVSQGISLESKLYRHTTNIQKYSRRA